MPRMLDARREQFCLFVAEGKIQTEAARLAGFPAPNTAASKLMAKDVVRRRVEDLRNRLTARKLDASVGFVAPTREYVLRGLIDNIEAARDAHDRGSVNKGLELVGKEIGMFVQRSMQIDSPLQRLPAAKLSELLRLIDETLEPKPVMTIEAKLEAPTIEETTDHDSATDDGW